MGRQGGQLSTQVLAEESTLYQPVGPDCAPHNKVEKILKGSLVSIPSPSVKVMGMNPGYLPKYFLLYNLPTQLSVVSYTPDSAVGSRRQMDKIYGSLLRDDISRSCILLPSNSRKPIFHNFQVHLSFFLSVSILERE